MIVPPIPVYSLAFAISGFVIGRILNGDSLGFALAGIGSIIGYVMWLRARMLAIRAGKSFHLGSVVNIVICTYSAIGIGIYGLAKDFMTTNGIWLTIFFIGAMALFLHWRYAKQSGNIHLMPTGEEVIDKAKESVLGLLEEPGSASLHAVLQVGAAAIKRFGPETPGSTTTEVSADLDFGNLRTSLESRGYKIERHISRWKQIQVTLLDGNKVYLADDAEFVAWASNALRRLT